MMAGIQFFRKPEIPLQDPDSFVVFAWIRIGPRLEQMIKYFPGEMIMMPSGSDSAPDTTYAVCFGMRSKGLRVITVDPSARVPECFRRDVARQYVGIPLVQ